MTCSQNHQLDNIQAAGSYFPAAATGTLPSVSWITPSGRGQRAPAGQRPPGPGLRHRADQRRDEEPGLGHHGDLPELGRLGRLLRRRRPAAVDQNGYGLRVPGIVISPYAKQGYIDHQTLSFDAYLKFIEDDFLGGARLNPQPTAGPTPGRACARTIPSWAICPATSRYPPRPPLILPEHPAPGPASTPYTYPDDSGGQ